MANTRSHSPAKENLAIHLATPNRATSVSQPPLYTSAPASVRWAKEIEEVVPTQSPEYSDDENVSYARGRGHSSVRVTHLKKFQI